ncbi:isochorismate synthase [bacterium]|nr:isochorismate synthase [bacterium]
MMSLENIQDLISSLHLKLKQAPYISGLKRVSISLDIGDTTLKEVLSRFSYSKKGYMKSVKCNQEIIFIGSAMTYTSSLPMKKSKQDEMNVFIQETSCNLYGGTAFLSVDTAKNNEWEGISDSEYWVAYIEILKEKDKVLLWCNWPKHMGEASAVILEKLTECLQLDGNPNDGKKDSFLVLGNAHNPDYPLWHSQVNDSLNAIQEHKIEKIVLAKQTVFELEKAIDASLLVQQISNIEPSCSVFFQQFSSDLSFLSVTPETLFLREGNNLTVDVIAGTQQVKADNTFDDSLLNNTKNLREHKFVYSHVLNVLKNIATAIRSDSTHTLLKLAYVEHITKQVTAVAKKGVSDFDILECLHPTPAVAGHPTEAVLALIKQNETFNRGWYAGAVGVLGKEKTELLVGIRSCVIRARKITVFTGAGIVEGSTPEKEWEELLAKTKTYMAVSRG